MKTSLFRLLCAASAVLLTVSQALASVQRDIATEEGSGIKIEVICAFDNIPRGGAVPLRITVHNRSGTAGTWRFTANRSTDYGSLVSATAITVEPGQSRTVPMMTLAAGADHSNYLNVSASGPGTRGNAAFSHNYNSGSAPTEFLAMSTDLTERSWETLKKHVEGQKRAFDATRFEPADLPNDWRGYSGVEWLAFSDSEWNKLAPDVQAAIRQWVGYGGRLVVAAQNPATLNWSAFHLGDGAGPLAYGLGEVRGVAWDGKELKPEALAPLIMGNWKWDKFHSDEDKDWSMCTALGDLKPNTPLILGFVIVFAVMVGPINLFLFAPAVRRHRMFWTTPLLSLGGSILLMGVIFLQEGTGGSGRRFAVVQLLPETHEAVVVQDQVTRTGLLLGSGFSMKEEMLAMPVHINHQGQNRENGTYSLDGKSFSGDWFKSRSVQAQRFAAIRPTRAEVVFVGHNASGAPLVVSSIDGTLQTVFVTDEQGKIWRGDQVRTGEKVTLRAASQTDDVEFRKSTLSSARDSLRDAFKKTGRRSVFIATVAQPKGELLATLSSIRWKEDRVVYLGPVSQMAPTQTGAVQP